jgi:2-polyprenyl-3-methyl-5-hydroxy-6-metoxy-1,4-benzoquinol methylase
MRQPDPDATQEHWDSLAATYDDAKARNDVYYRTLKACFAAAVPESHRDYVLEVGCGTGQLLASLHPRTGVGIDLSEKMIEMARRKFADRPELRFNAIDAESAATVGAFDAVISGDVMEHVSSWELVVSAMVKACREDGIIAISTPNPHWAAPLWILEKLKLKMPEGPHRFVKARKIARQLETNGCSVLEQRTHLVLPIDLAGLGPRISSTTEQMPILRGLGVIQMIIAAKQR